TTLPAVTISLMATPHPLLDPCPPKALRSRSNAAEISTAAPFFQATLQTLPANVSRSMHIAVARPLLPSLSVMHCSAWPRKTVRTYGSRVRRNERARRRSPPGLSGALPMAEGDVTGRSGLSPPGSGAPVPPDRHHLCRLWRRRSPGAADPLRCDPKNPVGQGMEPA